MLVERILISIARVATALPRGNFYFPRLLAKIFPTLRNYPLNTRYGRIYCDLRETVCQPLLAHGEYPWWRVDEEAFAKIPLSKQSVVLDIGANIGVTVRLFAERAGEVHAFEPSGRALRLLRANVADLANVKVHPVAIADAIGTTLFEERTALDVSGISDVGELVPMRTVDCYELLPDFIKIDVEGFESRVLLGATKTISCSPIIVYEALSEEANEECQQIILAANPHYCFEMMPGGANVIAWPTCAMADCRPSVNTSEP